MIYTIGTDGKTLPQLIEMIQGIDTVMDVRFSAVSYSAREFSNESLAVELPAIGIRYVRKPELGVPFKRAKSYKEKTMTDDEFERYYRENHNIDTLEIESNTVLLSACAYANKHSKQTWDCYRSILAQMLVETGKVNEIIHL